MSTAQTTSTRPLLGTQIGTVVSDKRDKSRTVAVAYQARHPKYGKYLKRLQKYQVHDEQNESKAGDRVQIASCRPISKSKSWRLVKVVERALPPVTNVPAPEIESSEDSAE